MNSHSIPGRFVSFALFIFLLSPMLLGSILFGSIFFSPTAAQAQWVPLGPWKDLDLECFGGAAVGMDSRGRYALACDRIPFDVGVFQTFDTEDKPASPEILFGRTNPESEIFASGLAADGNGSFLLAWSGHHPTSNAVRDISVQFYGPLGNRQSRPFRFSDHVLGFAAVGGVARNRRGDAVVMWTTRLSSDRVPSTERWVIHGQRFSAGRRPVGPVFTVRTSAEGGQVVATGVTLDEAGRFVVIWHERPPGLRPGARGNRLFFQRFARDATPRGKHRRVTADLSNVEGPRARIIKEPTGEFVVVWYDLENILDGGVLEAQIKARWYDPFGRPLTEEVEISGAGDFDGPNVTRDRFGNTIIVWSEAQRSPTFTRYVLQGRIYDRTGQPLGDVLDLERDAFTAGLHVDDEGHVLVTTRTTVRRYELTCIPGYESRCLAMATPLKKPGT